MMIEQTIASIVIKPSALPGKIDVNIDMPVWIKTGCPDGRFHIKLPLLGELSTYANTEGEIDMAIQAAVHGFYIASNLFGEGFNKELEKLGWQVKKNKIRFKPKSRSKSKIIIPKLQEPTVYNLEGTGAYKQMSKTGVQKNLRVAV